jgi:hypothetical protein
VEFVFVPEERDVYSYRPTPKDLTPLGAKFGSGRLPTQAKAVALLRSFADQKRTAGYKHLAPNGTKLESLVRIGRALSCEVELELLPIAVQLKALSTQNLRQWL